MGLTAWAFPETFISLLTAIASYLYKCWCSSFKSVQSTRDILFWCPTQCRINGAPMSKLPRSTFTDWGHWWDELSWGWKLYLPTYVCFLVPYCAGLALLLKSFACMHVGYEIANVWESISSWSQLVPMQSISIYPHHTHICRFPSVPCTVGLNERVSVLVGAIMLYFYSGDPRLLWKIQYISWTP